MPSFNVREFSPLDYQALEQIHNSLFPEHPYFRKRAEYEDSCFGRTRHRMKRLVAETSPGVVGFCEYRSLFFQFHPRKFAIDIEVLPEWQGRGIGGALHEALLEELAEVQAEAAWPMVLSTHETALTFLRERRYAESRRILESRLDLERFDGSDLARSTEKLEGEGITIASVASELQADPAAGRKVKELEDSGSGDVPGAVEEIPMSYHDYELIILESPVMLWDGSFIAKEGDDYVAYSSLLESGVEGVIDQGFTVVRPTHRGRNLAQAVKLRTAEYARSRGARYIRTHNDSANHPMLAVNRKMGFAQTAEWITLERML